MNFENTSVRPVETRNYLLGHGEMTELYSVDIRPGARIVGLEDLRLYEANGEIKFLATACNLTKTEAIRISTGEYDRENRIIYVNKVFDSPSGEYCEKNWTFLDSSTLIYKWFPLTTYSYDDLTLVNEHPTPIIFNKFRGSSSVIEYGEHRLAVVHSVHHDSPRKYLHWLVLLDVSGRPVGYRSLKPMLPDFLDMNVNEIHIEMANREFAEIELLAAFAEKMDVSVGIIDVKNYYIESINDVKQRIKDCLKFVPAEKLSVAPDCGLSQTARWAAKQKLINMVEGARQMR
jgi:hypothetical protein